MKLLRAAKRAIDAGSSAIRLVGFRALYPGLKVGNGVTIGPGVHIQVLNDATLTIGERVCIQENVRLECEREIIIGADSFIGAGSVIVAARSVRIGRDALIGSHVVIRDQDHGTGGFPYRDQPLVTKPVVIGDNVWIGAGAVVLKGVSVGDNAIIGAGAVVTKNVAANAKAVGVPAR